jgi:hypothetical protein
MPNWIISNDKRPNKDGLYYTEDSVGNKFQSHFTRGHWISSSGHPISKWLYEEGISFTLDDMKKAYEAGEYDGEQFFKYMRSDEFKDFIKEEYNITL